MNSRGQAVVIRELFAFAIGVAVMIAIVSLFNNTILPKIRDFSINEEAYLALFHVHSLIERTSTILRDGGSDEVIIKVQMPDKISDQHYRIFVDGDDLCLKTSGKVILKRCINLVLDTSVSGNFLSGTEMKLDVTKDSATFDNVVDFTHTCTILSCNDNNPCTRDVCFGTVCFNNALNGPQPGCIESTGCSGSVCSCVNGVCESTCGNGVCGSGENPMNCFSDCGVWNIVLPTYSETSLTNNDVSSFNYNGSSYNFFSNITYDDLVQTLIDMAIYDNSSALVVFSNKTSSGNYSLSYSYFNGNSWSAASKFCCENDKLYNTYGHIDIDRETGVYWMAGYNYTNYNIYGGIIFVQNFSGSWSSPYKLYQGFYTGDPRIAANHGYRIVVWDANEYIKYKYYNSSWQFSTNATEIISGGDYDAPEVALDENGNFAISYSYDNAGTNTGYVVYWNGTWCRLELGALDNEITDVAYFGDGKFVVIYPNSSYKYRVLDSQACSLGEERSLPVTINYLFSFNSDRRNDPYLIGCASASDCKIMFFNRNTYEFSYYPINN